MKLLSLCILMVTAAGLCRGGAEEPMVTGSLVSCVVNDQQTIQLECDMERRVCSSREETLNNDRFLIQDPYENPPFRVKREGTRTSDDITYECRMIGFSTSDPDLDDQKEKKDMAKTSEESAEGNTSEQKKEEQKKNNKHNCKENKANNGRGHGQGHDCPTTTTATGIKTTTTTTTKPTNITTAINTTATINTTTAINTTAMKTTTPKEEKDTPENESEYESSTWVIIVVLIVALLFLIACCFYLWRRNKKLRDNAGGSQVEKLVTVYAKATNPGEPAYTKPDHIYQEIPDPPQAQNPQSIPYSIARMASYEDGATPQNIPYSVVNLSPQKDVDSPNMTQSADGKPPQEDGAPQSTPFSAISLASPETSGSPDQSLDDGAPAQP